MANIKSPRSKGPLTGKAAHAKVEGAESSCPDCGARLELGSDHNGVSIESCPSGCFRRPVPLRRPGCPSCSSPDWEERMGCRNCGHGWTVRASAWDGTVYFWVPPGWSQGKEVPMVEDAA